MTNSANITKLQGVDRKSFEQALREMEDPLWQLKGLSAALRMVCRCHEEIAGEKTDAVKALQFVMEDLHEKMQRSFDSAFA